MKKILVLVSCMLTACGSGSIVFEETGGSGVGGTDSGTDAGTGGSTPVQVDAGPDVMKSWAPYTCQDGAVSRPNGAACTCHGGDAGRCKGGLCHNADFAVCQ